MKKLDELNRVTQKLAQLLEQPVTVKNRDQMLNEINQFLDQRENLLKDIKPPYSETDAKTAQSIMEKDKEIQLKLDHLFLELKSELRDVKRQKSSSEKYLDPYRHVASNDGTYWDKKK